MEPNKQQCLVIGENTAGSTSPAMHNAGYRALGLHNLFSFSALSVTPQELPEKLKQLRNEKVTGISVTIPHKLAVIPLLDEIDETANAIGAVNTIYWKNGKLTGTNTDWLGVLTPLTKCLSLDGKRAAIIGAGGAARAACYALQRAQAQFTVFNRSLDKAQALAKDFSGKACGLADLQSLKEYDILINSVPYQHADALPCVDISLLHKDLTVFDMIYKPHNTKLLQHAAAKKAKIIHGIEMLLHQGLAQFEIYTGRKAPVDAMREAALQAVTN